MLSTYIVLHCTCVVAFGQLTPTGEAFANSSLLDDITRSLDTSEQSKFRSLVARHSERIAPVLSPSLQVLPKNEEHKLTAAAVRYVLHRFFVQNRGWRVEGLDPEGSAWNKTSLDKVVALERLPHSSMAHLTSRINASGLALEDVLSVAAMIEISVHAEAVERLVKLFRISGLTVSYPVRGERAVEGLEYYMSAFIMGANLSRTTRRLVRKMHNEIHIQYPAWPKTKEFIHEIAASQNITANGTGKLNVVNFSQVSRAVEQLTDKYGRWQNYECLALKQHLLELEDQGTGRVRLADFYGVALNGGKWQFTESVPYLRELGALDESNPSNLRVIIPNYVNGASNCVGSTKYGSLCCISECWGIFEKIETALGVAEPTSKQVATVVASVGSSTVPANRTLNPLSLIRLQSIAASHDGVVPVHGRLFAQWLHHVYPRECDFPHRSGTTQPKDLYDMEGAGESHRILASQEDMKQLTNVTARRDAPLETMAWSNEEELLYTPPHHDQFHPVAWMKIQLLATCAAIVTMIMGLTRSVKRARRQVKLPSQVAPKTLYSNIEHMAV